MKIKVGKWYNTVDGLAVFIIGRLSYDQSTLPTTFSKEEVDQAITDSGDFPFVGITVNNFATGYLVNEREDLNRYNEDGACLSDASIAGEDDGFNLVSERVITFDISSVPKHARFICRDKNGVWYWSRYRPIAITAKDKDSVEAETSPEDEKFETEDLSWDFAQFVAPDSNKKVRKSELYGAIPEESFPQFEGNWKESCFCISEDRKNLTSV